MSEARRESYEDEAEAPFDPKFPRDGVFEWEGPADVFPGPVGLCWDNARAFVRAAPDEYLYAEGFAWVQDDRPTHGWAVRRSDGAVVECTKGYATTTRYRGMCFEIADVEKLIDNRPLVDGRTCRERWRTKHPDGSTRSEAPGVFAILAEEYTEQGRCWKDFLDEQTEWLGRWVDPFPRDL
jgi:hypothetical protein